MKSENSSHHPVVKYLGKFPWSNEIGQYWVKLHLVGVLLSRQFLSSNKHYQSFNFHEYRILVSQNTSKHRK